MAETIVILAVVFAIIGFLVYASKSGAKLIKEREEKINRAEKGSAKVISFTMVGLRGTGQYGEYQANRFTILVSSAYKEPYQTTVVWNVYTMGAPKVQEGSVLNVKIDIDNPMTVYPMVNGVEYSWMGEIMERSRKK